MLKFFEDFAKLNPEPAPAPAAPTTQESISADDIKDMFNSMKESIINEIKTASTSQEAVDDKPDTQGANTTNNIEGGNENAS